MQIDEGKIAGKKSYVLDHISRRGSGKCITSPP